MCAAALMASAAIVLVCVREGKVKGVKGDLGR